MAMNYNLHAKPAEILVDQEINDDGLVKTEFILTKKQESFNDILRTYTFE